MERERNGELGKADALMKEADKKMKGGFFKNLMSSKSERIEESLELIKQAANIYKLAKAWEDAAGAYLKCAELNEKIHEDASDMYQEAANMQKKFNTAEAARTMDKAIKSMCNEGKISQAARLKKQTAEMYETEKNYLLAAKAYQDCFDLHETEGEVTTTALGILMKVPELRIVAQEDPKDIIEGIKIYERVGNKYLENKLTRGSAKDCWFRVCLLHLANDDTVGASNAIEKVGDEDPTFLSTKECKFIQSLVKAMDEKDPKSFTDLCSVEFNDMIPFDRWKTVVLNRAKAKIENEIKKEFEVV